MISYRKDLHNCVIIAPDIPVIIAFEQNTPARITISEMLAKTNFYFIN